MKISGIEVVAAELETPKLSGEALLQHIDGLKRRYDEPWRRYHVFEHPLSLFAELIKHRDEVKDPRTIGWTILYHDAIYDPRAEAGRNEELSALLSESETPLFLTSNGVRKVAAYTRATAGHLPSELDEDLEFFLDTDLSVLGASPARYGAYSRAIREEYSHVDPEIYNPARISVLRGLATRFEGTNVYATEIFRSEYEKQAQVNIAAEIESLSLPR